MYISSKMITTDIIKAKEILKLSRLSGLTSFKFAKKYFKDYKYRMVKNSINFAREVELGLPVVVKEVY